MITTVDIVLMVIIAMMLYIVINQYFKILAYEKMIEPIQEQTQNNTLLITKLIALFTSAKQRMSRVDKGGAFSSDDEVGFAFKLINSVIIELTDKLLNIKDIIDGKEDIGE